MLATGKRLWWLHDMRGVALARQGQKAQALKEFQAAAYHSGRRRWPTRSGRRDHYHHRRYGFDPETALSVLQPRIGIDAGWRLLAIRLYQTKGDDASALKLAEAVAADPLASSGQRLNATEAVAECAARQRPI